MSGCKDCMHDHWSGHHRVCALRPYDSATSEQQAIVSWLTNIHVDPHSSPGCPSFKDFRNGQEESDD